MEPPQSLTVAALKALDASAGNPPFRGVFVLRRVSQRAAKNGNPFLVIEAGDRTGSFNFNAFSDSPVFSAVKAVAEGEPIRIEGRVEYYQDRLSPRILKLESVPSDELGALLETLIESAPEDSAALWEEFRQHIAGIADDTLRATVESVFNEIGDAFRTAPAAIAMHHAYRCGLLEHTVHMARACRALLPLYPEVHADLALAGVLLHDIGKTDEYVPGLSTRRSRAGILQGHVVLGYRHVRKAGIVNKLNPELLERLEHIILSHQGELEWGAAAMAATPEAVFVSLVDNLDAKMGMVQRALRQATPGDEFSDFLPGLKAPVVVVTPPAAGSGGANIQAPTSQEDPKLQGL
jgi:3'-5' exoribonuclease